MFTYLHHDKAVEFTEAMKYPVLISGADPTDDPTVIRVFQSNADLSKWADRTTHGEKVREVLRLLNEKVLPERGNEQWVEQMQRLALRKAQDNFGEFAKLLHRSPLDEEVIRKAMVERTLLTPKMFDPVLLYDREIEREPPTGAPEDSHTSTLIVPSGWWPNLKWIGWNDRARSARIFGVNILCQHTWFGGRWGWLIGFNGLLNLRHIGFDRITSSVISF